MEFFSQLSPPSPSSSSPTSVVNLTERERGRARAGAGGSGSNEEKAAHGTRTDLAKNLNSIPHHVLFPPQGPSFAEKEGDEFSSRNNPFVCTVLVLSPLVSSSNAKTALQN